MIHSAGSAKTNSISWIAHGLSSLHDDDDDDDKVFDTVIVVTDRTVLDDQPQKPIKQIEGVDGTVATINADQVRNAGDDDVKSKSSLLAKELLAGRHIVIVTMQTFLARAEDDPRPHRAGRQAVRDHRRRGALLPDRPDRPAAAPSAHHRGAPRPRTTAARSTWRRCLPATCGPRSGSPNRSFFAFSATPKNRTLQLVGNVPEEVTLVDESEATKGLMRWVSLHPTNIAQRVPRAAANHANVTEGVEGVVRLTSDIRMSCCRGPARRHHHQPCCMHSAGSTPPAPSIRISV